MRSLRLCLRSFHRSQDGAAAIIFALFLNVAIAVLALCLDAGRAFMATSEMNNAATAAALGGAIENGDKQEALDYFAANLPNGQHSISYNLNSDVEVTVDNTTVSVIPTNFNVPAFFSPAITAGATTSLKVRSASVAGIATSNTMPADYIFMVDISGSMGSNDSVSPITNTKTTRIQALKEATLAAVDEIFANPNAKKDKTQVGIVNWHHEVREIIWPSSDPVKIKKWINDYFAPRGGTCGSCGLEGGDAVEDATVQDSKRLKVFIFMTDGVSYLNPYSEWDGKNVPDYSNVPVRMLDMPPDFIKDPGVEYVDQVVKNKFFQYGHTTIAWHCLEGLKTEPGDNATVWAIRFGAEVGDVADKAAIQTMDYCASSPDQSVYAEDGVELDKIFKNIITVTGKLKLLK